MPKKVIMMNAAQAEEIDANLRRIYAHRIADAIPERLQLLLLRLREKDQLR